MLGGLRICLLEGPVRSRFDAAARRLAYWTPLLARFFWLQSLAQFLAMVAGLLVVRALGIEQFAAYTVALATQTTMVILADGGITQALMARGGPVAGDRGRFSQAVQAAISLRVRLQLAALAIGLPLLVGILRMYDVGWWAAGVAAAAVGLSLHASVRQTIFSTVLFLQLEPARVQRAAALASFVRVGMLLVAVALVRNWLVFLCIGSAAALLQAVLTERAAMSSLDPAAAVSTDDRAAMLLAFRNQLLNGIYFALQPQITVWILTAFGTAAAVAEVGALGRLAIVFALLSSAFSSLALPRFARATQPSAVRRQYALFLVLTAALGAGVVGLAWLAPGWLLLVLGPQYTHLRQEVLWVIGAGAVSLACSAVHLLNTARNWVRGIWLGVPLTLAAQVFVATQVDLSTIYGAVLMQVSAFVAPLAVNIVIGLRGLRALQTESIPARSPAAPSA